MKDKAIYLGKRFISHELVTGSSLIILGTTIGNFFAFLFNIFIVRQFSPPQYGEYAALISLITLVSIPAQSIQTTIIKFGTLYFAKKELGKVYDFFLQSTKFVGVLFVLILIGFVALSFPIQQFLHISNVNFIILSGLIVASMYLSIPNTAMLQSLIRFDFLALTISLGGAIKLLAGMFFVAIGWGVGGAFWGIFLSFLIPYLITFLPLRNVLNVKREKSNSLKTTVSYALPTVLAVLSLSSFTTSDILLAKHFFNPDSAGAYAALSLVGRIIFYFTAPITTVMFPLVIKRFEEKKNFQRLFYMALILVLIPSFALTAFYFLFPHVAIDILFANKYRNLAGYLGWFGVYICIFSFMNVLVTFFLSLGKTKISYILALGAIAQVILISLFHATFTQVIFSSSIVLLVLSFILLIYYFREYEAKIT